ncbi:MAG: ChaN family lipoprotein, partial [Paracoccaceae bacterium]
MSADDLDALPRPDVIILGEIHDNPIHHRNQARAVAALKPAALVFEMLTPEKATKATPDLRGDKAGLGEALGWADSGWPDFSYYYPIFAAAPQAKIFGGDLPRGHVRRAVEE